jgi:predicted membrane channel-forming protein YqfA (hemolysin III family)
MREGFVVDLGAHGARIPKLPTAEVYDRVETTAILVSLAVFVALFIWFTFLPDQRIFQYYLFAVMVTLLFCGVLKAVGVAQRAGLALGGAIVIFGVILYFTDKTFRDSDLDQKRLRN